MTAYPPPSPPYVGPPRYHSGTGNRRPGQHPYDRLVLHGTVSPTEEGGARNIARLFTEGLVEGSCHYVTDPGEVVQAAYDDVVCWHAPPNPHSLGIEFCDWVGALPDRRRPLPLKRWNGPKHRRMLRLGARLAAELCLAYNLPPKLRGPLALKAGRRGMTEHDDVSRAYGQSSHWDLGEFPRRRFARMVREEVKAIKAGDTTSPIAREEKPPTRITKARDLIEDALDRATAARKRRRVRKLNTALENLPRR